jgi:hydroxymethylpyrimidine/phosphomethylpyrimidine kinase
MKTALTISGSDSCGGAGLQADLKTFSVLGVYGMSAITTVTAQNTLGVKEAVDLEPKFIRSQIETVAGDIQVDATKTGLLATAAIVGVVADAIRDNKLIPLVVDPVMYSKSGTKLIKDDAVEAIRKWLIPQATLVAPNLRETLLLMGSTSDPDTINSIPAAKDAAKRIKQLGAKNVLIKGIQVGDQMVDLFFDGREFLEFAAEKLPREKSHGAGSALTAAITAGLANRLELVPAIDQAKHLATMAIQYSDGQGRGVAPVNVLAFAPKKK